MALPPSSRILSSLILWTQALVLSLILTFFLSLHLDEVVSDSWWLAVALFPGVDTEKEYYTSPALKGLHF